MADTGRQPSRTIGYVAGIVQAMLYATMGIFGKLLYACGLDAQQVMVMRFLCTVIFLGAFIALCGRHRFLSRQRAVYVQSFFLFISAGFCFLAIENMNAGLATVVFYTFPTIVALMNVVVFHEHLSARIIIALILSLAGVICICGPFMLSTVTLDALGIAFALAASVAFASYTVCIQKTARVENPFTTTLSISLVCLAASCLLFANELPGLAACLDLHVFTLSSALAILSTIAPIVLFIFAVWRIGATRASIVSIAETPSSLLLAYIILGETIDLLQALGSTLVVISILVVTLNNKSTKRE